MRILIAGASGFLGTGLVHSLTDAGHQVQRLVRREPSDPAEIRWNPSRGELDPTVVAATDAVINLSGANVNGHRWSEAYKRELWDSRIGPTATLAKAIAEVDKRPATMISSSAVGFYGDTGDRAVDEQSPSPAPGAGFLAELCTRWEEATRPAEDAGVRVVHLRTGFPLDRDGGLLKPLLLLFRLGGGAQLGNGTQYLPWISRYDWEAATRFLLDREDLAGPVNLTGPEPVTNATFTAALAHQVHRPALLRVPRIGLKVVLGEFADEALASQRVRPGVLTAAGFTFRHPDLAAALRWATEHRD
jgi:uncharacterized protein (TIGR01777 family)